MERTHSHATADANVPVALAIVIRSRNVHITPPTTHCWEWHLVPFPFSIPPPSTHTFILPLSVSAPWTCRGMIMYNVHVRVGPSRRRVCRCVLRVRMRVVMMQVRMGVLARLRQRWEITRFTLPLSLPFPLPLPLPLPLSRSRHRCPLTV